MKPLLFGCSGPALTAEERAFFEAVDPAGFILFGRNIVNPQQLKTLTTDLRLTVGRSDVPILIDQEGGRVQRMGPPAWRKYPAMGQYAACAPAQQEKALKALSLACKLMADDLLRVGINVDCLPLLDVPVMGADNIIGDRAFGFESEIVQLFGQQVVDSLKGAGVHPVIKHIPGHGRAVVDSHLSLPVVDTDEATLRASDFAPFKAVKGADFAMTAHIVYTALDKNAPATLSKSVIETVIRGYMGFEGLLMTDDLSMKALQGGLDVLAEGALSAGCDLILHCNGQMAEMQTIAAAVSVMDRQAEARLVAAMATIKGVAAPNRSELESEYEDLLGSLGISS